MREDEAIECVMRDLGVDEAWARFILSMLRGETSGDAFVGRPEEGRG